MAPDREAGSVVVLVSICLAVIVVSAALTIDIGRIAGERRDAQNLADAVALDLVRLVDGRTSGQITSDPRWEQTRVASLARNDFEPGGARAAVARLGSYAVDSETFTPVASADEVPTAVRVEITDEVAHHFAPGATLVRRHAVAGQTASAGVALGSFAARLDSAESTLLGPILADALGVTVVGYEGLAGGAVRLEALAAELGLAVASPSEMLETDVTLAELVAAQAAVLAAGGDLARAEVLRALLLDLPAPGTLIRLGDLVEIGAGGLASALTADLDVLELLTTTALVVNGDSFIDVPGLALAIPGLTSTTTRLRVIQPPRWAFGGVGTQVRTAQVDLSLELGIATTGLLPVTLDVALAAAPSVATIVDMGCGRPRYLDLDVATGLLASDATLSTGVQVRIPPLVNVAVPVDVVARTGAAPSIVPVSFTFPPDEVGVARPVGAGTLALAPTVATHIRTEGLGLAGVVLNTVLGVVGGAVDGLVSPLAATALGAIDATVVQPLLSLLGVTAPGADVTPLAVRCTGARLVA